MKSGILNPVLLSILLVGFGSMVTSQASAQTFTTLHSFSNTAMDGASPFSNLVLSSNTLYGLAGGSVEGIIFAVNTDGTGFTNLYGYGFSSSLILYGNTLYGAASTGGDSGKGAVFKLSTDGTGFTVLYNFSGDTDGALPSQGGLTLSSNTLYGTANGGGAWSNGTVFAVNTDGSGFRTLHSFTAPAPGVWTNGDGAETYARLIVSGNTLYGTAEQGGSSGQGTVFKVNSDGTGFSVLHTFTDENSDGSNPYAGLILSGNTLYGTTFTGGNFHSGTVFAINLDRSGFTTLHSFAWRNADSSGVYTNSDGANPYDELFLSGNTLYGTTSTAGTSGQGTVFAVNTDGSGFRNLHNFEALNDYSTNVDGAGPWGGLILSSNTLYGTTLHGGKFGVGTVFSLSLPATPMTPLVRIRGQNLILSWPTNASSVLLSTTNLSSPVWSSVPLAPVVVNGQNTVTNPMSGRLQFYRLSQ